MPKPPPTLQIEADHSLLIDGTAEPVALLVSPRTLVARHWPHGRPGPLQLERAIDDVENAIEQAGLKHADRGLLIATPSLRQLLPQRLKASSELSRDDVEAEFSRLVTSSSAAGQDAWPASAGEAAATLLLLREVMHHLGFQAFRAVD